MQSRMNKYYENKDILEDTVELPSRMLRNQELYKDVSNKELDEFDVNSNSSVLNENINNSIDIDKIKEILDRKYKQLPKNKSIGEATEEMGEISLDETREYDINAVLDASHKEKEVDYEEERLKKIRNTQVDILKELDSVINAEVNDDILKPIDEIHELDEIKRHKEKEERKLRELIDTITAKELISEEEVKEIDPLDILSDLKGDDDDTKVLGIEELTGKEEVIEDTDKWDLDSTTNELDLEDTITEETKLEDTTNEIKLDDTTNEIKLEDTTNEIKLEEKIEKNKEDNTVETGTLSFTQSDFDDFDDLKEDMHFTKILIKILIIIIVIVFIIGCIILANKVFHLGLF